MKRLEINPVRHDISVSVSTDEYEKLEEYRTVSIQLCDGGETASGAITAEDCLKLSKWFAELATEIKTEQETSKKKEKKKHGKSKNKKDKK